jgi:signal transduction histidine kinase
VDLAVQQVRTLSFDLRPALLDDLGLAAALGSYARRQAEAAGLKLHLSARPLTRRPPSEVETACFRIGQEAITNVVRHARARRLDVTLRHRDGMLELQVKDDGAGFAADGPPQETWGLGLLAMEERAVAAGGALEIQSHAGRGTAVRAYFPLLATAPDR